MLIAVFIAEMVNFFKYVVIIIVMKFHDMHSSVNRKQTGVY